jgi:hypothetical protein
MIGEALVLGSSLVGCFGLWAAVAKHRLNVELQKHKITTDYNVLKGEPEPPEKPTLEQLTFDAKQHTQQQLFQSQKQALDHLLERRRTLEDQIAKLRTNIQSYADKQYAQYRADAVNALNDARKEQQELVDEQRRLLATMEGDDESEVDAAAKPVRVDTGGPVAERVDDSGVVHAVELHDEEASREGAA